MLSKLPPETIYYWILPQLDSISLGMLSSTCKEFRGYFDQKLLEEISFRDNRIMLIAAERNYLDIMKWAYQRGAVLDSYLSTRATLKGSLQTLEYLYQNQCPFTEETSAAAAWRGDLQILIWLRERNCPWNELTCVNALIRKHTHILNWAIKNGCLRSDLYPY